MDNNLKKKSNLQALVEGAEVDDIIKAKIIPLEKKNP